METNNNKSNNQQALYLFGFLGFSCFTCCALISLIIGVVWLSNGWTFAGGNWWIFLVPILLIIWGTMPFIALILYYRKQR